MMSLDNQQTPLMRGHFPLLCIDLWEHAYYLDFKSERETFLKAMVGKINWENVRYRYDMFRSFRRQQHHHLLGAQTVNKELTCLLPSSLLMRFRRKPLLLVSALIEVE